MPDDRRNFQRLETHVVWRSAGLHVPQHPVVDLSLGGMLVYSDEMVKVGKRLEVELLVPDEEMIELHARVVRVDVLPKGGPARYDLALEFLDVRPEARARIARKLGVTLDRPSLSEARVDEEQRDQVGKVEDEHRDEGLLEPSVGVPLTRGPRGDHDVREQNGDQDQLLHRLAPRSEARRKVRRNVNARPDGKLNVLFVTPYLPSPPRFGGQRRLHGLISGIAQSHDVSVLSLVDPSEEQADSIRATEAYCRNVTAVPNRRYGIGTMAKRWLQIQSLLSSRSYEWLVHREEAFDAALDKLLATERYDVVHFEFTHMANYRKKQSATNKDGPVFLLDEHNIEYDLVRQVATAGATALRRAYSSINWRKVSSEEHRAWAHLDGCTLTSARDEGMLLADAPKMRTAVVPNGVDLDAFQPRPAPEPVAPATLLFFGAIDYYPNTDGLLFFLGEIMPLLSSRVPRVRLCIVGRRPPDVIVARRSADVEITGAVDDLIPYLERATVVIVPLRIGGGTRLKILEAMSMSKAIVSTTIGAEGLDAVPERDLLIADDPETFAKQVRRLLDDPALAQRLGRSARRLVEARFGWKASVERLSDFYGEVIEARASA